MTPPSPWRSPRIRNLRLVREPDRVQTRVLLLALAGGLAVVVPLMANVWGQATAVRLGYRLQSVREARTLLLERNRRLRLERAARADLSSVQKRAVEDLGLAPRLPSSTIVVSVVEPPRPDRDRLTERSVVVTASRTP